MATVHIDNLNELKRELAELKAKTDERMRQMKALQKQIQDLEWQYKEWRKKEELEKLLQSLARETIPLYSAQEKLARRIEQLEKLIQNQRR